MNDKDFEKLASTFGFAPSRALRELLDAATAQAVVGEKRRCMDLCQSLEDEFWRVYKGRSPADSDRQGQGSDYVQGASDGAGLCVRAIAEKSSAASTL